MKVHGGKLANIFVVLVGTSLAVGMISHAQPGGSRVSGGSAAKSKSEAEEREQIWNSPQMLRARAWLQDYCSKSKKVTPEMAKEYMTELENLSPAQMRLWLVRFDHEEEQRQQQYAFWQQGNALALQHAQQVNQQTQQAYNAINQAQSESAELSQQRIDEQRAMSQEAGLDKQMAPYYGGYPYNPYGLFPGYGGYHIHYHMYPY